MQNRYVMVSSVMTPRKKKFFWHYLGPIEQLESKNADCSLCDDVCRYMLFCRQYLNGVLCKILGPLKFSAGIQPLQRKFFGRILN